MSKTEEQIKPEDLFREFRKVSRPSGWKYANNILEKFKKMEDNKDEFIKYALKFMKAEIKDDVVRSWGTTLLEYIGSQEAFESLINFLKDEDASKKNSYSETRLFAVRAIAKMAQTPLRKEAMKNLFIDMAKNNEEAISAKVGAMIVLSKEDRIDLEDQEKYEKTIKSMLQQYKSPDKYNDVLYTLRAIREIGYPMVFEEVQEILDESTYVEHKRYAIKALGQCSDVEAIDKLGLVVKLNSDSSLRLEAVKSLANINSANTQSALFPALLDDNAEIRYQASKALKAILDGKAVRLIIQSALDEYREENSINRLIDALRIVDDSDRTLSTEILNKEILGEDRARSELAQTMLLQLGGWAAVQKLSQRKSTIETLDKMLQESETVVKQVFQATILQARRNFYFAMGINITIVIIGLVLISIAIMQVIREPTKLESWIIPGVSGLFGVILTLFFNNPRNNAREDLATLMNVNVIFLGFLRQLNEIDAAFKHTYMESSGIQAGQDPINATMTATVAEINKVMTETLEMASIHLRLTPKAAQEA
jgi:HEAT repeat protein